MQAAPSETAASPAQASMSVSRSRPGIGEVEDVRQPAVGGAVHPRGERRQAREQAVLKCPGRREAAIVLVERQLRRPAERAAMSATRQRAGPQSQLLPARRGAGASAAGRSPSRRRTMRAPVPFGGPQSLWPLALIRSTRGCRSAASALPNPLRRVDVQERRRSGEPVRNLRDRLLDAGLVVDLHHRDEQRVGPHRGAHAGRHPPYPPGSGSTSVRSKPRARPAPATAPARRGARIVVLTRCRRRAARP